MKIVLVHPPHIFKSTTENQIKKFDQRKHIRQNISGK